MINTSILFTRNIREIAVRLKNEFLYFEDVCDHENPRTADGNMNMDALGKLLKMRSKLQEASDALMLAVEDIEDFEKLRNEYNKEVYNA